MERKYQNKILNSVQYPVDKKKKKRKSWDGSGIQSYTGETKQSEIR